MLARLLISGGIVFGMLASGFSPAVAPEEANKAFEKELPDLKNEDANKGVSYAGLPTHRDSYFDF